MCILGALVVMLANGCSAVFYAHDKEFAYATTAAHCVRKGDVVVAVHDGRRFGCRVIEVDEGLDMALLKADVVHVGPVACPIVPVRAGEEVVTVGYPGGQPAKIVGRLSLGTFDPPGKVGPRQVVQCSPGYTGGISGGGVFTDQGLCAVATHSATEGGGCGILDRITDRAVDRTAAKTQDLVNDSLSLSLRDLVLAAIGWFVSRKFGQPNSGKAV